MKILYITTISDTINAFLVPHIKMLIERGHKVDCAANLIEELDSELLERGIEFFNIPFTRNPLDFSNIKAFNKLVQIQKENNYDVVHVHTPVASIYGRLLKLKFPKLKTIYTVHGFHFYKGAPIQNWCIFYPIEKIMSKLTDSIVTINSEDYNASLKFKVNETYKIDGVGVDLDIYNSLNNVSEIRKKLGLKDDDFVILMIAEVNKNKNHKQVIDAIDLLNKKGIDVKLLCAGEGVLLEHIKKDVIDRNLSNNIKMLGYRTDINELITACDIGIMTSYREGLPRSIMELMAHKKPVIGTNIRGIRDLVIDEYNGYLVEVDDSKETANKIELLQGNKELLDSFSKNAFSSIQSYSIDKVINQLEIVYSNN